MTDTRLFNYIRDQMDHEDLLNMILEKISEPGSDRPNPIEIEIDMKIMDEEKNKIIRCTSVIDIHWEYYMHDGKYFFVDIPSDNTILDADNTEIDDYDLLEIYDITYEDP